MIAHTLPQRQHRGSLLHDNMDGTLSVRGHYAKLRDGEGQASGAKPKPGIVVSVGALDPSEPLMVAPSLPEQGHGRYDVDNSQPPSGAGSEYSGAQSPVTSLAKVSSAAHFNSPTHRRPQSPLESPPAFTLGTSKVGSLLARGMSGPCFLFLNYQISTGTTCGSGPTPPLIPTRETSLP